MTSPDPAIRLSAAKAWSVWEASTSYLLEDAGQIQGNAVDEFALAFARLECHYFVHGGFFEADDQLLRNASRLKDIPAVIVQVRYDVVCPARSAWDLHRAWPEAGYSIIEDAGHSSHEPGIAAALVAAMDRVALTGSHAPQSGPVGSGSSSEHARTQLRPARLAAYIIIP